MSDHQDPTADKKREARLRRMAADMGLALRKSRSRDPACMDFGCYRVVKSDSGETVAGRFPYEYSLDLDAVEEVLDELQAQQEDRELDAQWRAAHPGAHHIEIPEGR
ncbi:MAG: hypothetical protein GX113_09985 [Actinobacteria bacterium]|jgi:hypothetical protein|nr:hypothetical protein [Actinomycetota bacterium]